MVFKYKIGQKVYTIGFTHKKIGSPCKTCEGKKKVIIKKKEYNCPACKGTGVVNNSSKFKRVWNVQRLTTIRKRTYTETEEYPKGTYTYNFNIREDQVYATKEEAQKECDRLNILEDKRWEN